MVEEWKNAVQVSDNKRIKHLFQRYTKYIDIHTISFANGNNTLQHAARTGNHKLCKLLIILGVEVCHVRRGYINTLKNNIEF